jgi:hypothetical protein
MNIFKYDWQFEVDIDKTKLMYNNREKSEIDVQSQLPELKNFLIELGIDIEKPDEHNFDYSDVIYTIIGNAKSKTKYEIDIYGQKQYISIAVYDMNGTIMLEVFGMKNNNV